MSQSPPGPLLQIAIGSPDRTSPHRRGTALLGHHHTLGAPPAGCRARALNTEEPAALRASTSQALARNLRVRALDCHSLCLSVIRLPRSRRCRP
ncbi:hypothetical protein NDU88_000349 [Pleurodeles waltl]|uniref:Uncharacterized protein n=1 Tax=Pleurodeles waltl TaxID=8319 RepID=A0AAV7UPR6_PLEWA|nr:hypothetical protein NDU88_000349 [Pleurodeles waltl]